MRLPGNSAAAAASARACPTTTDKCDHFFRYCRYCCYCCCCLMKWTSAAIVAATATPAVVAAAATATPAAMAEGRGPRKLRTRAAAAEDQWGPQDQLWADGKGCAREACEQARVRRNESTQTHGCGRWACARRGWRHADQCNLEPTSGFSKTCCSTYQHVANMFSNNL